MLLDYTLDFEKQRLYFTVSHLNDLVTENANMEKITLFLRTLCRGINIYQSSSSTELVSSSLSFLAVCSSAIPNCLQLPCCLVSIRSTLIFSLLLFPYKFHDVSGYFQKSKRQWSKSVN